MVGMSRLGQMMKAVTQLWTPRKETLAQPGYYHDGNGWTLGEIDVSEIGAMRISEVYAAVRVISEAIAGLPVDIFERQADRDVEVNYHPVKSLLTVQPNVNQSAFTFREARMAHLLLWGNSYCGINRDSMTGEVYELIPMMPWQTTPRLVDGRLNYKHQVREYDLSHVLHTAGFSFNGMIGQSSVSYLKDDIKLKLAQDKFARVTTDNLGRPFLALKMKGQFSGDEAAARFIRSVKKQTSGDDPNSPLILENEMDLVTYQMPLGDAQLLDSRIFEGKRLAMCLFKLPASFLGHMTEANYNSMMGMDTFFTKYTITPWLARDEAELNRKLFAPWEQGRFYLKFKTAGLERGDIKTRFEIYKSMISYSIATINEVRALEDLPPLPEGDKLAFPANIWGNNQAPAMERQFAQLLSENLSGLVNRERVHLMRSAGNAEKLAELPAWYEKHEQMVLSKLKGVVTKKKISNWIQTHRRQVEQLASMNATSADFDSLTSRWVHEVPATCLDIILEGTRCTTNSKA